MLSLSGWWFWTFGVFFGDVGKQYSQLIQIFQRVRNYHQPLVAFPRVKRTCCQRKRCWSVLRPISGIAWITIWTSKVGDALLERNRYTRPGKVSHNYGKIDQYPPFSMETNAIHSMAMIHSYATNYQRVFHLQFLPVLCSPWVSPNMATRMAEENDRTRSMGKSLSCEGKSCVLFI